jgi:hypothetical protein
MPPLRLHLEEFPMKSLLRLMAFGTFALACTACSPSGNDAAAGGGSASLADCQVVITRLYDLTNINSPETAALIEKQINQCAAGNSLSPEDVACVTKATDMTQFTACGVTNKMGS